ncbi:MAG TPA: enoyl-CoA hydratase/isomerase family protein [Actinophytocola sp.]|uniref:enoyl-CoA hydratase/isomerase family protein n=1 Tax=Actinophytocola sp. TaxID=1872138 RepID=UPI002DDD932C|nr:enoyl-CoA hydratase/isomerase family protein [Actinophytocola sp.]HEV2782258.1 enoyl-CoA hydratase/isomerase family protein [Actinophytocola sp.]
MTTSAAVLRRSGAIAEIVLNRPAKLNAMNMAWMRDLDAAVGALPGDRELRVVVVRGAGRAFCSGLDLDMMAEQGMPPGFFATQEKIFTALERLPAIVVAQIHGYCLGGGLQLALACDVRIASADAMLGLPAALEGLVPGVAAWRLPRFVGLGRALRLALLGKPVDAATALDMGLVDHLLPVDGFGSAASEIVSQYAEVPHRAAVGIKEMARSAFDVPFDQAFTRAQDIVAECLRDPDTAAARQAWANR